MEVYILTVCVCVQGPGALCVEVYILTVCVCVQGPGALCVEADEI